MRVAVISDIHGNLHALEAVLEAIDGEAPDEVWCLGDLVGYGPRPNECCASSPSAPTSAWSETTTSASSAGSTSTSSRPTRPSAPRWTREVLDDEARAFLETLEPEGERDGVASSTRARATRSGSTCSRPSGAYAVPRATPTRRSCSSGTATSRSRSGSPTSELQAAIAPEGTELDLGRRTAGSSTPARSASRATATRGPPGSCSTSRRGTAAFRRVEYDVERTQAEIRERGLPEALAARLEHGV